MNQYFAEKRTWPPKEGTVKERYCSVTSLLSIIFATGKWLLMRNYIDDSYRAGRWLDEACYECSAQWRHPETRESELPAAARWRQHVKEVGALLPPATQLRQGYVFTGVRDSDQGEACMAGATIPWHTGPPPCMPPSLPHMPPPCMPPYHAQSPPCHTCPPSPWILRDANEQAVCILLECTLVCDLLALADELYINFLLPANKVCEGYVFTPVCQ